MKEGLRKAGGIALAAALSSLAMASSAYAQQDRSIVIVVQDEPDALEPCQSGTSYVGRIIRDNVVEALTRLDSTGSVKPLLASSWDQVDDLTWRFTLRPGILFHDGTPFDAKAAAFSIERARAPKLGCDNYFKVFAGYDVSAKAIDDLTVEIKTDKPNPILPTALAIMTMVPTSTPMDTRVRTPVGTGPYKLEQWVSGDHITLERNDSYWGDEPEVTKATYVFRQESAVRAAMVQAGEADLAPSISPQDATDPAHDIAYLDSETTRFRIDMGFPPFNDIRVRRALNYAIDRKGMLGTLVPAEALPATNYVTPAISGNNGTLQPYPYDPEKARALLAEARADGVPVDTPFTMIGRIGMFPTVQEFNEAIADMLQGVGFNVTLQMLESANHTQYQRKPFPQGIGPNIFGEMHDNNLGDAGFTVFNKYHSDGVGSTTSAPQLDKLIEAANVLTGDKRRAAFENIFKVIYEDVVPDILLFHMVEYSRVGSRILFQPGVGTNSLIDITQVHFRD